MVGAARRVRIAQRHRCQWRDSTTAAYGARSAPRTGSKNGPRHTSRRHGGCGSDWATGAGRLTSSCRCADSRCDSAKIQLPRFANEVVPEAAVRLAANEPVALLLVDVPTTQRTNRASGGTTADAAQSVAPTPNPRRPAA